MLLIILESGNFAYFDSQNRTPLSVALDHVCIESLNIMCQEEYKFDFQQQDSTGISFIGLLIKKLQEIPDE
jgi:hypothetical protein